jgi:membrane protein insertase Oxa1/YidC/SpoIIIJ
VLAAGSFLDPLYKIVGLLLAVLYYPLHSLGLAIIVLTLIVMFVQLPLIAKQTRSMILMQRVQPEI